MKKAWFFTACMMVFPLASLAKEPLKVTLDSITDGQAIAPKYAHCAANDKEKSGQGQDISPPISWTPGPIGTRSYAVIVVDDDVPTVFDDAGKEGKTLPADMKRQDFYHWTLVDIPVTTTSIAEGKGRDVGLGVRGVNDYAKFHLEDPAQALGYNGPCPPWNDERVHHYHFRVYALDVESLDLKEGFAPDDAMKAIKRHTVAKGEVTGTYTLNPALPKAPAAGSVAPAVNAAPGVKPQ